jgi:hypothetical protein
MPTSFFPLPDISQGKKQKKLKVLPVIFVRFRPGHSQNKHPIGHQFQEHPAPQAYISYSFSLDISPVK